jgi:hypothetical protein
MPEKDWVRITKRGCPYCIKWNRVRGFTRARVENGGYWHQSNDPVPAKYAIGKGIKLLNKNVGQVSR